MEERVPRRALPNLGEDHFAIDLPRRRNAMESIAKPIVIAVVEDDDWREHHAVEHVTGVVVDSLVAHLGAHLRAAVLDRGQRNLARGGHHFPPRSARARRSRLALKASS